MVLDTNILLANIADSGIVIYSVLTELDRQKTLCGEIGYKARRAIRRIQTNPEDFILEYFTPQTGESVDDALIRYCRENDLVLTTMDLSLKLKAVSFGVTVEYIAVGKKPEYNPIVYLGNDENLTADFFCGKTNYEYAIIHNKAYKNQDSKPLFHGGFGNIKPLNAEQQILFDILFDKFKKAVVAVGSMGTGKSFLLLSYALHQLQLGNIKKIVMVSNNSIVENSRDIGTLPGAILEKELIYCSPLLNLMTLDELTQMYTAGNLEIVPLSVIRGRSFDDSIVYISEAQNLSTSHVKLLLGRVGENSRIFFDGDIKQVDNYKFKEYSGLEILGQIHQQRLADFLAYVVLRKVERSEVAQLADLIDHLS